MSEHHPLSRCKVGIEILLELVLTWTFLHALRSLLNSYKISHPLSLHSRCFILQFDKFIAYDSI